MTGVRWEDLFCDLEAQLDAAADASWQADVSDQARAERGSVLIEERLRGARSPLRLRLVDGSRLTAGVTDAGEGWVLLRRLGAEPWEIARDRESAEAGFAGLPRDADHRDDWISALVAHPRAIQRPIILLDDGTAVVARDPETLDRVLGT